MKAVIDKTLCLIKKQQYPNKRIALEAIDLSDGSPFARLTTNLVNESIASDEAFIDVNNLYEGVIDDLSDAGVIEKIPIRYARSGYVIYPLFKVLI